MTLTATRTVALADACLPAATQKPAGVIPTVTAAVLGGVLGAAACAAEVQYHLLAAASRQIAHGTLWTALAINDQLIRREDRPVSERIFLETVLDGRRTRITERSLTADEQCQLLSLIRSKYAAVIQYLPRWRQELQRQLRDPAQVRRRDANEERALRGKLTAIEAYQAGVLTQDFVDLMQQPWSEGGSSAQRGALRYPSILAQFTYLDYPDETGSMKRTLDIAQSPAGAMLTLLGTFQFRVDAEGRLVVEDGYDFNPPKDGRSGITLESEGVSIGRLMQAAPQALINKEQASASIYDCLRDYAGVAVPSGTGREVQITLAQGGCTRGERTQHEP